MEKFRMEEEVMEWWVNHINNKEEWLWWTSKGLQIEKIQLILEYPISAVILAAEKAAMIIAEKAQICQLQVLAVVSIS